MLPETTWVCESCGHLWSERRPDDDDPVGCESCGYRFLQGFPTRILGNREAADEYSANVVEEVKNVPGR